MTDQQGLSIFDPGQPAEPVTAYAGFPIVRRGGYDKTAVDDYVRSSEATTQQLREQVAAAAAQLETLSARVDEVENPTYSGLGGRAAELLTIAERQADEVISRARAQAEELRRQSSADAEAITARAAKEAEDIRVVQLQQIDAERQRVIGGAEQERMLAAAEAKDMVAAARREADQVRLAAHQESNDQRVSGKRESERIRASVERELSEARRQLAVEKERLAKEAADYHAAATGETKRLVVEAEQRANAAEERAATAMTQANKHREESRVESERLLSHSRREAEQIVAGAKKQAGQVAAQARADAERQTQNTRAQLDHLQRRRDGIVTQLAQLSEVVSSFSGAETAAKPRSAPPTAAPQGPPAGSHSAATVGAPAAER
ncbi:MAG: hypothetical protein H0V48_12085 [Nocardioidaceae bacterium]|nr:hypothetical protein [Nocardioidaceae bacterium]